MIFKVQAGASLPLDLTSFWSCSYFETHQHAFEYLVFYNMPRPSHTFKYNNILRNAGQSSNGYVMQAKLYSNDWIRTRHVGQASDVHRHHAPSFSSCHEIPSQIPLFRMLRLRLRSLIIMSKSKDARWRSIVVRMASLLVSGSLGCLLGLNVLQ